MFFEMDIVSQSHGYHTVTFLTERETGATGERFNSRLYFSFHHSLWPQQKTIPIAEFNFRLKQAETKQNRVKLDSNSKPWLLAASIFIKNLPVPALLK